MGVTVTPGATFSASLPRVVHEGRFFRTINGNTSFSITRDGARFLRIQPVDPEPAIRRIELVLNWFSALPARREHPMSLGPGSRLGGYEITAPLASSAKRNGSRSSRT